MNKQEIIDYLQQTDILEIPQAIKALEGDPRKFVLKLCEKYLKIHDDYLNEKTRLFEMSKYEREFSEAGFKLIGGTDEVGRGPLAGPVAACVVILPQGFTYPGINDSKKVSAKKRDELSEIIKENAVAYGVGLASVWEIDELNILQATKMAMARAYENLETKPDFLLTDAIELPEIAVPQKSIVGGDRESITIASASIVAKVYRDNLMEAMHELYPQYGFNKNKGYGSASHIEAIKKYGASPVHRQSFIRSFV